MKLTIDQIIQGLKAIRKRHENDLIEYFVLGEAIEVLEDTKNDN